MLEKFYFVLVFGAVTFAWAGLFDRGESANTAVSHATNPVLLLITGCMFLLTLRFGSSRLRALGSLASRQPWLTALYGWMLLTIIWSVSPSLTAASAARMLLFLAAAFLFALRYPTEQLLRLLDRCLAVTAVLSLAGQLIAPHLSDDGAPGWTGIFPHKNTFGFAMMMAIVVLIARRRPWTARRWAKLLFYLPLLVLSQSFTSVLSAAVAAAFLLAVRMEGRKRAAAGFLLAAVVTVTLVFVNPFALILAAGGKGTDLTGRDAVWAFASAAILQRPLQGFGYGAFWADSADSASQALNWIPGQAHNGYIQICLDLGAVGLVLAGGLLFQTWRRGRRLIALGDSLTGEWVLALIVMTLVHNLAEADLMSVKIVWFLVITAGSSALRREAALRAEAAALDISEASPEGFAGLLPA